MAYDPELAERLRATLGGRPGVVEKRMFGGLAFLLDGHLAISASSRGGLLVRVDPDAVEQLIQQPHVAPFEMRGREMRGWLHVGVAAVESDAQLRRWVERGINAASAH